MNWGVLSKYKSELYGISILWIMFFHGFTGKIKMPNSADFYYFACIFKHGNFGVDIFVFLSGIFLFFSLKGKSTLQFYKKRIVRLGIPFLLIDGCYWIYTYIFQSFKPLTFFKNISFYAFWIEGNNIVWFIAFILLMYLIYPVVYHSILLRFEHCEYKRLFCIFALIILALTGCIVLKNYPSHFINSWYKSVAVALTRVPIFLLGCFIGPKVYHKDRINLFVLLISVIGFAWFIWFIYHPFSLYAYYNLQYFATAPLVTVCIALALDCFCLISGGVLQRIGVMSLELYLIHIIIRNYLIHCHIFQYKPIINFGLYFVAVICFSLILSFYINKFTTFLVNSIMNRTKHGTKG